MYDVNDLVADVNDLVAGGAVGKCVSTAEFPHQAYWCIRPHNSSMKSSFCGRD